MPFLNRIRLPFKVTRPQFPEERTKFRKANGESKTISVVVRKTLEGVTDWMPEKWHEKLVIALSHDEVAIEGDKYLTGIQLEAAYQIDWSTFLDYPTAPAKFVVEVTPFNATNSNCQTCTEATQVDLTDDEITGIYGGLEEDTEYEINVADNDSICCSPAVFSVTLFNPTYLDSATIDQSGNLTIMTKTDIPAANNINLVTYRVTCPNGGYDEASVYGSINGSIDACLAPLTVIVNDTTPTGATFTWTAPDPVPASGYIWEIFNIETIPEVFVQSGTEAGLTVSVGSLEPSVDYRFYVRGNCGDSESNNISVAFTTEPQSDACGQYQITYQMQPTSNPPYITINATDCFGDPGVAYIILPVITKIMCLLQSAPGEPANIVTTFPTRVDIEYLGPC